MNQLRTVTTCLASVALSVVMTTGGLAQSTSNSTNNESKPAAVNWVVNCNNQQDAKVLTCGMSQTLLQAKTRQRIARTTIVKNLESWMMIVSLPHGLDILSGVQVSVDQGKTNKHPFQTADATGIFARFIIDDDLLANLRAGSDLKLKMTSASKKTVDLKMSLQGFSDSFALLNR